MESEGEMNKTDYIRKEHKDVHSGYMRGLVDARDIIDRLITKEKNRRAR